MQKYGWTYRLSYEVSQIQLLYGIAYMRNLKKSDTNELRNRFTDIENKPMVTKGERWQGWGEIN